MSTSVGLDIGGTKVSGGVVDEDGRMTDDAMRARLAKFLDGFAAFAAAQSF